MSTSLENLLKRSDEMASLPQIYHTLTTLLKDPDSTPAEIARAIQMDPFIAAKVLKTVNSAFFGFPRQIDSIEQAVTLLGRNPLLRGLKNLLPVLRFVRAGLLVVL